ncbi:hypothetical protein [uncultured Sphingomonas sp.]|nr:hypothetical protein [uncultured Sphingomonas sp.]
MTDPDQRTQSDDHEDATNQGASSTEPAEGADDAPGGDDGSPAAA